MVRLVEPFQINKPAAPRGIDDFQQAAEALGLVFDDALVMDGEIHRIIDSTHHKARNNVGWYVCRELDSGLLVGAYGSWFSNKKETFDTGGNGRLSFADRIELKAAKKEFQEAAERKRVEGTKVAKARIEAANEPDSTHQYLERKKIEAHGISQQGDLLVIPIQDIDGNMISTQTIDAGGTKRFQKDAAVKGGMHVLGVPGAGPIYVAEGYATAASIFQATGQATVCAFSSGNIPAVVEALRSKHSNAIRICADRDEHGAGERAALQAIEAIRGCSMVLPDAGDFNDMAIANGLSAVAAAVAVSSTPPIEATPVGDFDFSALPTRNWLYGRHLIRGFLSTTIAPGGVGKTQVCMADALAIASGRQLLHDQVFEQTPAWHYNLEDPIDELKRRLAGLSLAFEVPLSEVEERLFLNSGRDRALIIAERQRDGTVLARPEADELAKAIEREGIGALSIDPFVRSHFVEENNNKEIDEVLKIFGQIANDTGCAIDLVHHVSKAGSGRSGDMDAARGASSMGGAVRSARTLTIMTDTEAEGFGVEPDRTRWYVRVDDAKSNMAPPADKTLWLERRSIDLGNLDEDGRTDWVGVLQTWKPPDPFDDLTVEQSREILIAIDAGTDDDRRYNANKRGGGKRWAGHVIIKATGKSERASALMLKTWITNGVLKIEEYYNKGRRKQESGLILDRGKMP